MNEKNEEKLAGALFYANMTPDCKCVSCSLLREMGPDAEQTQENKK